MSVCRDNGSCKHCVALIFSLSSFCERHRDRGTEVCTDVQCVWDKPRKKSNPNEIINIETRIDSSQQHKVPTPSNYNPTVQVVGGRLSLEKDFYNLCKGTDALLLQTLYSEDSASDDNDNAIPTLKDVFNPRNDSAVNINNYMEKLKEIYTSEVINDIEEITLGQNENPEWFDHRKGRITASLFSSVKHFRFTDQQENYISKKIMGKTKIFSTPSLSFGTLNEPIARQQYFEKYKLDHKKAEIKMCGLFIDPNFPFLGASPDGLIKCKCCGEGLVEIKCSFVHKNSLPTEACMDDHYHIYLDENENVRLKIESPWYLQIQGQLGVCKRQWCDFVFFTKKGYIVDRILFDEELFKSIVSKATKFFETYIIPALIHISDN